MVTTVTAISPDSALQPPVDRQKPWRITGTPYSAARITTGDLATRLADLPENLPVMVGTPAWNRLDIAPVRSTAWDGALVLYTTPADPDPNSLTLDLPAPAIAGAATTPSARRELLGALTVRDLATLLADLPDHAPVMVLVPGWNGTAELVADRVDDYDDCLLLDTDYPTCDPFGQSRERRAA
ncbi:hypothetical protein ACFVXH_39700 [Kitasatospora sp. NPDC058184]|uniref:hypothetical protein n=1 Tax=Kitasatospora sp. NPDC058184 TaxID=3346370 RepID=UPI0036DAF2A2